MQALHRTAFPVMGTTASVHVDDRIGEGEFETIVDELRRELDRLESMFSVFRPDSEISRINRGTLHLLDASAEVIEVLDTCSYLEHVSGGAFSVRRHRNETAVDPSGFVKGWAAEKASALLSQHGVMHWYLGVGGDFTLHGGMYGGEPWRIGIVDPRDNNILAGTAEIVTGAVATSGTAERGAHLWDPRTGTPATHFQSVTVSGPSLKWADAFATIVFVLGAEGPEWLSQFPGYDLLTVS